MQATHSMHGNVTTAAWIFGGALVIASLVLVLGIYFTVHMAMKRADASTRQHAEAIERAGAATGEAFSNSLDDLAAAVREDFVTAIEEHGSSVEASGAIISEAFEEPMQVRVDASGDAPLTVQLRRPLAIEQPVVIEGTVGEDRALSVNVFE